MSLRILALDLGTCTGWAIGKIGELPKAGTETLATAKEIAAWGKNRMRDRQDPRILRYHNFLQRFLDPDVVVFEDVNFHTSLGQSHLWASYRGALWTAFQNHRVLPLYECLDTGKLKIFATGNGHATKEDMKAALLKCESYRDCATLDDNAIDAIWLWKWAAKTLCNVKRPTSRD